MNGAALVPSVAATTLHAVVALKNIVPDAVAGVILDVISFAPLATEAPAIGQLEREGTSAAPLATKRIMILSELGDVRFEAVVAASAKDVSLGAALEFAAEESVCVSKRHLVLLSGGYH
jgi:hypothetical protein